MRNENARKAALAWAQWMGSLGEADEICGWCEDELDSEAVDKLLSQETAGLISDRYWITDDEWESLIKGHQIWASEARTHVVNAALFFDKPKDDVKGWDDP